MTALNLPLKYGTHEIRTVGTRELPEWVGSDVCDVLAIRNSRDALASLPDDEKGVGSADTPGGRQQVVTVTEAGLYRLIFKSRKAEAQAFKKWVVNDVLPCIRKYGTYPAPAHPTVDEVELVRGELAQVQNRLDALPATMAEIVSRTIAEVLKRNDAVPLLATETVASRLGKLLPHWNTTADHRAMIRNRARANVKRALGQEPLCVHAGSQLEFTPSMIYHLDTAIFQTYRQALRDNEVDDYGLYADVA